MRLGHFFQMTIFFLTQIVQIDLSKPLFMPCIIIDLIFRIMTAVIIMKLYMGQGIQEIWVKVFKNGPTK